MPLNRSQTEKKIPPLVRSAGLSEGFGRFLSVLQHPSAKSPSLTQGVSLSRLRVSIQSFSLFHVVNDCLVVILR
jgi:hypothetical protein